MAFLSIVTPVYNRASLLRACYRSLRQQTCFDFEWIIVDDGSVDAPEREVSGFSEDLFPIHFIQKENGGKHTALNAAHPHIHGKYVLILDSDDYLTENAVEQIKEAWEEYANNPQIGVVIFLRGSEKDAPLCTASDEYTPVDILRYRRNPIRSSDCCEVIRTELFLQYPFPVFPGERFVAECALWNRVAITHKCIYINEVIYICEYLAGGLTDSGRAMRIRSPRGGMYTSQLRMCKKNYFKQRIKYGLLYCCYGYFAGIGPGTLLKENPHKVLTSACMLPGYILYRKWKKEYLAQG